MCLSCTVSEILEIISQNLKRSRDFNCTPMLQNFNMCNASTLCVQSANHETKFEMSSSIRSMGPKYTNESRDSGLTHLRNSQLHAAK